MRDAWGGVLTFDANAGIEALASATARTGPATLERPRLTLCTSALGHLQPVGRAIPCVLIRLYLSTSFSVTTTISEDWNESPAFFHSVRSQMSSMYAVNFRPFSSMHSWDLRPARRVRRASRVAPPAASVRPPDSSGRSEVARTWMVWSVTTGGSGTTVR